MRGFNGILNQKKWVHGILINQNVDLLGFWASTNRDWMGFNMFNGIQLSNNMVIVLPHIKHLPETVVFSTRGMDRISIYICKWRTLELTCAEPCHAPQFEIGQGKRGCALGRYRCAVSCVGPSAIVSSSLPLGQPLLLHPASSDHFDGSLKPWNDPGETEKETLDTPCLSRQWVV